MNKTIRADGLVSAASIEDLTSATENGAIPPVDTASQSQSGPEANAIPHSNMQEAAPDASVTPEFEENPLRDFISARPIADQIVFEMFLEQYPETGWEALSKKFQDMLTERGLDTPSSSDAADDTVGIYGTFGYQYMAAVQSATFLKATAGLAQAFKGDDWGATLGSKVAGATSTTMSYSHWMSDTVQNMARKVNSFWDQTDDTGKAFLVTEALLSGTQVATNVMFLRDLHAKRMHESKQAALVEEIRAFHTEIAKEPKGFDYGGIDPKKFETEQNFKKLLELHEGFLEQNKERFEQSSNALQTELTRLNESLENARKAAENAEQKIETAKQLLKDAETKKTEVDQSIALDMGNEKPIHTSEDYQKWKAEADKDIEQAKARVIAEETERDRLVEHHKEVQNALKAQNDAVQEHTGKQVIFSTEYDKQSQWVDSVDTTLKQDFGDVGRSASKWGGVDNGVSMLRGGVGLGFWNHEKNGMGASDELLASLGLGIGSDAAYTVQSLVDFNNGNAKGSAALGMFGATVGVASVAVGLADITRQLNNPDLTDEQREALTASAALQGSMMGVMAAEGVMSAAAMLSHSATALKIATKGVPIAGAVVTMLSVLDPVSWQRFDAARDYIDALRENDDGTQTNGLLADRLQDTHDTEVAHYASATAVDAAFGIAAIGLAATGVGAPVAVAVALVGAAISTIIRLTEGDSWQREADRLADEMRTLPNGDQRTIEQYFEAQMDTRWDAIAAQYEERFDKILADNNFDSVIGLGSQSFTAEDVSLAIQSDTVSEMGKTAKHYGREYLGDGDWDAQSVRLDEGKAQIDLPGGDADKDVYLTFMTPLMLAVNDVYTKPMFNMGKGGGSTTTHVEGWTINDGETNQAGGKLAPAVPGSQTATTFDVANVITDYASSSRYNTEVHDLSLKINAFGGDDTYLADQAKVVFNGGAGEDTASYLNIDEDRFSRGIEAKAQGANAINVDKTLKAGSEYLQEVTKTKTEKAGTDMWGKAKYRTVEYKAIELAERSHETSVVDRLTDIEVLQASDLDDILDLRGNETVQRIFGFDGDDMIYAGAQTKVVLAGDGDDHVIASARSEYIDGGAGRDLIEAGQTLSHLLKQVAAGTADQDDAVFLFGGDDIDAVVFDSETMRILREQYAEQQVAIEFVEYQIGQLVALGVDVELARGIFEDQLLRTAGDDFSLALFRGIEHLVFDLAGIKSPVDAGMNGSAFTHFSYDLTQTRAAEEAEDGPPLTLAAFLSNPDHSIEDWLAPLEGYALPTASDTQARTDTVTASLGANQLHHFAGRVYLEADVTYEFQEVGDSWGALYLRDALATSDIARTAVLHEGAANTTATGSFTASKAGWYEYDYYAHTAHTPGSAALKIRDVDAGSAFRTLDGRDDPSLRSGFTSPMLAGVADNNTVLENHWHAQDFNTMIGNVLQASHGLPFLTRNTSKETYEDAGTDYTTTQTTGKGATLQVIETHHVAINLADWAEQEQADLIEITPGRLMDDEIGERSMVRYQGEIWLQQGETYNFRETADDKTLFTLEGGGSDGEVTILQDDRHDIHTEATFTAAISGWYDFNFYGWNNTGPGNAKLEIGVASEYDDAGDPIAWQFQTLTGNMAMAAKLDASGLQSGALLQGADLSESFIGSAHDDFIYGMDGHDRIEGGAGSDAMSGGAGVDTFVFREGSGHDLIMELYASDWEDNLFEIDGDHLSRNRIDDDMVLWFRGNTDDSLTLLNYYKDGAGVDAGPLRQHFLFEDGAQEMQDIQSAISGEPGWFAFLNPLTHVLAARDTAFAQSDVIQAALEAEENKGQYLNGSYQEALLGDIEDWLGLG